MYTSLFVKKVFDSLVLCGVDFEKIRKEKSSVGLGISGGADSVSLFLALKEILFEEKIPLVCVTVNHHIREKNETDGDMNFVKSLCDKACDSGFDVKCEVFELEEGAVSNTEKQRKSGVEEAARYLRYNCFEKAIESNNISYFCLAHNQNDNLETILMRFIKGSESGGIEKIRGKYIRPLLEISRTEIEAFLSEKNQTFRTDSTNLSDEYFRNKIRHKLIPVLDENFQGWKNALLTGEEKRKKTAAYVDSEIDKIPFSSKLFLNFSELAASKVLIREMNRVGLTERIPNDYIKDLYNEIRKAIIQKKKFSKRFSSIEAGFDGREVFVKRFEKNKTDFGFFDIIEKEGEYIYPPGKLKVLTSANGIDVFLNDKIVTTCLSFPFVIRSPIPGEKSSSGFIFEG